MDIEFYKQGEKWRHLSSLYHLNLKSFWTDPTLQISSEIVNDSYILRLKFSVESGISYDNRLIDESCELDKEILDLNISKRLIIYIDVLINPSFQVPCPYLYFYDQNGNPVSIQNTNEILNKVYGFSFQSIFDPPDKFIAIEHPVLGHPCYALHICGINEYLSTMNKNLSEFKVEVNSNIMLLQWFSIVGPSIGFSLNPNFYKTASEIWSSIL